LTGPRLAACLGQLTTTLNEGSVVNVASVYRNMERANVDAVFLKCEAQCRAAAAELREKVPLTSAKLSSAIDATSKKAMHTFEKVGSLRHCS
jgi:hypothetical protein